jgi:CRISPR-associated exonuclease Cas4
MSWLLILALGFILFGWFSLKRARTLQHETGLPLGRLVYADTLDEKWQTNSEAFYSARYHLTGKPDYLVETSAGLIPVEVKSANAPPVPYLGHLLQVAAYCLLVEETKGQTPPHGLLKYADALYEVDFTPELRQELLATLAEMRQAYEAKNVHRSHQQPNKCKACGFYEVCEEALIY